MFRQRNTATQQPIGHRPKAQPPFARRQRGPGRDARQGVILLIALGMLALFSVLIVVYVIFSRQLQMSSVALQERVRTQSRPRDLVPRVFEQVLSGSTDAGSAAFRHSIYADKYGHDSLQLRVAHQRDGFAQYVHPLYHGRLIGGIEFDGNGDVTPHSTLFRFPSNLAIWHRDNVFNPSGAATYDPRQKLLPPSYVDTKDLSRGRLNVRHDTNILRRIYSTYDNTAQYDDAYTGRELTFTQGPLKNRTFRIVRSFGLGHGVTMNVGSPPTATSPDVENAVASNFVIDLSELDTDEIEINGEIRNLWEVAYLEPGSLLYDPGPDASPGDVTRSGDPNFNFAGAPQTDDVGYQFLVNGAAYNGSGANPFGVSGVVPQFDNTNQLTGHIDTPNHRDIQPNHGFTRVGVRELLQGRWTIEERPDGTLPPGYGGLQNNATNVLFADDEKWDAADLENMFLAWQPSNARNITGNTIHRDAATNAPEILPNRLIGQQIVPSFHRPALFNYLANAPIHLFPNDPNAKPLALLDPADPTGEDQQRFIRL
ncbi:MAG: hypothetical protein AAFP69_08900, partial [Planctomycetota bacterium]